MCVLKFDYIHYQTMREGRNEEYLRYGQIIRIHGNLQAKRGLIGAKGFTDIDAKYLIFDRFKNISFYRQGLFQILPRGVFETHDQLAKVPIEKIKNEGEQQHEQNENEKTTEINALKARAEAQRVQYETVSKARFGDFIHFGEDVIFKHVDSCAYLSGSVRCSDGGLGAFKVQLSKQLSSMLAFKLLPFRSYQKQGDKIKLQSPLRIKNLQNRCYLSRQESQDEIKMITNFKDDGKFRQSVIINKFKGKRQNIVTTYSQSETWLIHLHESNDSLDDVQTIRTHDIITLKHTQKGGYLAVGPGRNVDSMMSSQKGGLVSNSNTSRDKQKYPILKQLEDNQYPCFSCLWEIQFLPTPRISPPTHEQDSNRKQVSYCLRDLLTGTFLIVGESKELKISNAKGDDDNKLENQSLVKIGNLKDQELDVVENVDDFGHSKLQYMKELPYKTRRLQAKANSQTQHGFRINKIDDETKKDVLFVLSTYEVLEQFASILKNPVKDIQADVKSKKLEVIDITLMKLIAYVKKCDITDIYTEILPKKKYQMILKDLDLCTIIFDILDNLGQKIKSELFKSYKKQGQISKSIFNHCYMLVFQIIKDNLTTKLDVSEKYLQIILKNAIQIQQISTHIHIALNEILNNNEAVVTKFLDESQINKILNIFRLKPPHQKFLNIFRSSCICGKTPIITNQKKILQRFFMTLSRDVTFSFVPKQIGDKKFKVDIKSCINKKDEKIRTIKDIFNISLNQDFQQTWRYFLAYLNLLADICYGRNYQAKKFVEELLTSELTQQMKQAFYQAEQIKTDDRSNQSLYILCTILEDQGIKELRGNGKDCLQAVLRLINYAFVDTANQNPILRLSRIRNYEEVNKETQINSTPKTQQNRQIDSVIRFLKSEIKNFKPFQQCDNKQKQFLLTVLGLLKSTLMSGYWRKYEQLLQLLTPLLSILNNDKSDILGDDHESISKMTQDDKDSKVARFKRQATKCIPSINLIIQCKQLVCDLIEIILDFRTDIRVTHCTVIFKDLMKDKSRQLIDSERIVIDGQSDRQSIFSFADQESKPKGVDGLYKAETWRTRLKQVMKQHDELGQIVQKMNLNSIMAGLSIYKNPELIAKSLRIQYRIHQRLTQIMKAFTGIGLVVSGQTQSLIKQIQSKRNIFAVLQDQNLLYKNEADDKVKQVLNVLTRFAHSVKKNFDISQPLEYINVQMVDFSMFQVFCERDILHELHQRLIRCSDIHPAVLKFLTLCRDDLKSNYSSLTFDILKAIYCFLTMLAKQSLEMKQQIAEWMPIIKQHLKQDIGALELLYEMYSNNKTHLYDDVKIQQIASLISQLIESHQTNTIYKCKLMNFFHCLIYFNQDVIFFNQSVILSKLQDSKKKCIYYKDDKNEYCLNTANIQKEIRAFEDKYLSKFSNFGNKTPFSGFVSQDELQINLSPQLTYYITVFDVFSSLVEGPNEVNMGKCRQVHSYNMLLQILKLSKICYPLKKNVRAYLNRLYYVDSDYQNISEHVIKSEIPLFIQDLDIFIMLKIGENNLSQIYFKYPIRFKYFESDFYLYLEEILVSLQEIIYNAGFKKIIDEDLMKNYQKGYYYLHYYIIRIFERLRYLKNQYSGHRFINNYISSLTHKLKVDFLDKFALFHANIFDKNQGGRTHIMPGSQNRDTNNKIDFVVEPIVESNTLKEKRMKELQKRSKKLIKLLRMGQIQDDYLNNKPGLVKNFPLTFSLPEVDTVEQQVAATKENKQVLVKMLLRLIYSQREEQDGQINQFINGKIMRMKNLLQRPEFKQFLSQQFKAGCFDLYELNKNSILQYGFEFVSLREYIVTIVKINTQHPQSLSNDLKQFMFRILRRFIEEQNTNHKDDRFMVDQWETDYWKHCEDKINARQKFLNEAEIPQLIIESLRHKQQLQLNNQILLFAIAFILGGNSECQKSILQKLKEDRKNQVFINIHELIISICRTLYSQYDYRKIVSKTRESFNVRLIDDKNFFDTELSVTMRKKTIQPPNTNQIKRKALSIKVFKRVFRFLQLLCQNNNIDNKYYMREQWDVEGRPKINSINMIEVATFQIRGLFKIMNKDIAKIPLPVLDFINEINQIPCSLNQKTLCQTTFFQDFCYMANFLSQQSKQKQRHFIKVENGVSVPCLDSLFQIYNKCINIVICVLEGNQEEIYKELSTKLQLKFLEDIIQKSFEELGIKTKQDIHEIANSLENKIFPKAFVNAINVMVILRKIREWDSDCKLSQEYENLLKNQQKKQIHQTLESYMLSIQIKSQDVNNKKGQANQKKTQTVYFPRHPILTYLSGQTRDMIMMKVGRQTQRQKLVTMLDFKEDIFKQIEHNFKISKEQKVFGFTYGPQETQFLLNASLMVSMLISIIWMFTTDVIVEYQNIIYTSSYKGIIIILSLVQTFLTVLYVGGYVNSKAFQRSKKDSDNEEDQASVWIDKIMGILSYIFSLPISILRKNYYIDKTFNFVQILFKFDRQQFMVVIIFAVISILGTFYETKYFTLHLIFIFTRIQLLENVFKAIVTKFNQLFYVSLLGIVFVYAFCIVTYRIYGPALHAQEQQQCDSVIQCLIDMYISGTINGGMQKFAPLRFAYDLIYFMFFGLLFENIISGIVIDTFAQLRTERNQINTDKQNKCYICGIQRATLQKSNKQFEEHVSKHFLWNYIFYLYCLDKKDSNDYSGLEYQISNKNKQDKEKDISWIPIYYDTEEDFQKQIQGVREEVQKVQEAVQKKQEEAQKRQQQIAAKGALTTFGGSSK